MLDETIIMSRITGENIEKQSTPSLVIDAHIAQRFKIIRLIGNGGMGNVYLAEDLQLSRFVAIKTIRPELSADEEVKKRIAHECRIHAAIGMHPNIVALYDRIEENNNVYLIMEYVEGILLSELLSSHISLATSLNLNDQIDIIIQILEGLAAIHQKEVIHRDIKPSNIIIKTQHSGGYNVKLMDFGIARAEAEDLVLTRLTTLETNGPGTPMYMAPERIDPKLFGNLSTATDLYSVGVILFQMLSDGPPFRGTMTEIFIGHLTRPPDLSLLKKQIPLKLQEVLQKALQKQPTARYSNARHFIDDIKNFADPNLSFMRTDTAGEKTLFITDSHLRINYNEATLVDTKKGNSYVKNYKRQKKLMLWGGVIVAMIVMIVTSYALRSRWFDSVSTKPQSDGITNVQIPVAIELKNQNGDLTQKPAGMDSEQPVAGRQQVSEPISKQQLPSGQQKTPTQQIVQPPEVPPTVISEQNSALTAYLKAKQEQPETTSSVSATQHENIGAAHANPTLPKSKSTQTSSNCRPRLDNYKLLGDSSSIQQNKECTN